MSIAAREARDLLWPWGVVLSSAALALAALTDFLAPPFWFAERSVLAGAQASASALAAVALVLVLWSLGRRESQATPWLVRCDSRIAAVMGEVAGLCVASAVMVAATVGSIAVYRNTSLLWPGSFASLACSTMGLAALAPGLTRLPLASIHLVPIWIALLAGQLGFLGRWFPLRTDRVWSQVEASDTWTDPARWAADVLVGLAGMALSVALARARRGSR